MSVTEGRYKPRLSSYDESIFYENASETSAKSNHQYKNVNGKPTHFQVGCEEDIVYETIAEANISNNHQNGIGEKERNFQGIRYIETISNSICERDGIIYKIPRNDPVTDKHDKRRESNFEKFFSYDKWTEEKKFLLYSLSISSGVGCLWRYPSIAYDTGGSFLICYIIMLLVIGLPLYYVESSFAQFSSSGPLKIWRCLPALKGIVFSQVVANIYLIIYVGYIMSISLFYIFTSMQYHLPWKNITDTQCPSNFQNIFLGKKLNYSQESQISSQAYWRLHLLQSDADTFTHFNWKLGFCLLLTWMIIYVCFFKLPKLHGKLLFVAAAYPPVGLLLCFGTILLKDGIKQGLVFGLNPKLEDLYNIKIWYEACVQCFISLGIGFGHVLVYSRHSTFKENISRNCVYTGVHNICITVLSSMLFFSILGTIANNLNIQDTKYLCYKKGNIDIISPIFIIYSEGFELIPQLWTILFFLILFLSALSNMMVYIETISSTISQQLQILSKSSAFYICALCCICGLFLTTNLGPVIVNSMDKYGVSITIFICSIIEVTGIFWMYGYNYFFRDVNFVSKSKANILTKIFYTLIFPLGLVVIGLYGIIHFAYNSHYQTWVTVLGWILTCIALMQLPIWIVESYHQAPEWGCINKINYICKPEKGWGPADLLHYIDWLNAKSKTEYVFNTATTNIDNPNFQNEYTL